MNIYRIWQNDNEGYDTFDSAVVIAENEEKAKLIYPLEREENVLHIKASDGADGAWVSCANDVHARFIGVADERYKEEAVILASFNAG